MQLLIIVMMLCLFAHDQAAHWVRHDVSWPVLLAGVVGPKLLILCIYAFACRWTYGRLKSDDAARHLRRLEWLGGLFRVALLATFILDLHLGLLVHLRSVVEEYTGIQYVLLLDELAVLLPTLALLGLRWWAYYPIERRLREAGVMKRIDQGLPVYPTWTRWQYVGLQFRYQVALILVPLICIFAWGEAVQLAVVRGWFGLTFQISPWLTLGGSLGIFLLTPLLIRVIWNTVPMPEGEIREHLLGMCKTHRVRVNELLLWRTHGGMVNAAVMGLIAPLRFILITDALLQQMPGPHVEAVMAHELAHVKKHHMVSLIVTAVALMGVVETMAVVVLANHGVWLNDAGRIVSMTSETNGPLTARLPPIGTSIMDSPEAIVLATVAVSVIVWVAAFGWVSRRAERQADSFAVAHLVRERGGEVVEPQDANTMIGALQHVAELSHMRVDKHSWRHGSIQWRQDYLKSLVGSPINRLPIDRQMRWVNGLSVFSLVAVVLVQAWYS